MEGYEWVGTWEDQNNYWVYYRLSKTDYQQRMAEKREKEAILSVDFFQKAISSRDSKDLKPTLVMLIKALEPINPYFGEAITATIGEKQIFLGNEIIQQITGILNSISFECPNQVVVKVGQLIISRNLPCRVMSNYEFAVKGMPVRFTYTERSHIKHRLVTDNNGMLIFALDPVRSMKSVELVKLSLDWESVVQ